MTTGCAGCNRQIRDGETYCVYGCSQTAYYEDLEAEREAEREREREQEREKSKPAVVINVSGGGGQQSSGQGTQAGSRSY
ncbi:hypothetical protein CORC01_02747 [Colletotrichum orchidophilum]|uniref:Uncharacterized protein n=1 Tax=Colletotrichum orchidophilum TaxID=1209926 RepID=A0A1G4BKA2_9PEZI|nr:uncharacterized protein CORC01_02747 [Colletotrichum orchidophilum]OHF01869.1 hypothetical protein CORC01_02747 [Colletotrichum orchidophilum]